MMPDFLILGPPRCASDFLFYSLGNHPRVCLAREREVHFFDRHFKKGLDWYRSFFSHCQPGCLRGEKTAYYAVDERAPSRIAQTLPDAKLIASFRNPVHRAYSHYCNWIRLGKLSPEITFRSCCERHPEIMRMGCYGAQLERYLSLFSREDMLLLLFDDVCERPGEIYREMCAFLGLAGEEGGPMARPMNASTSSANPWTRWLRRLLRLVERQAIPPLLGRLVDRCERRLRIPASLSDVDCEWLLEYYERDIRLLAEMTWLRTERWRRCE